MDSGLSYFCRHSYINLIIMKKFMIKYSPYIIGVIIGLMFGDRLFGGFFYDLGTKFGEWLGNLIF